MFIYNIDQIKNRIKFEETKKNEKCQTLKLLHLGQLKLLISEILFLSRSLKDKINYTVIYVGAAEGYHIKYLADMFPQYNFILYDPGRFAITEDKNIKIHNDFFTIEVANKYANEKNILFISDIRTLDIAKYQGVDDDEADRIIIEDNKKQLRWIQIIKPVNSLLKFRLPYKPGNTKYLEGKIYLQNYSPISTETRLMVKRDDINKYKEYSNEEYDEKMAYFNCNVRMEEGLKRWMKIMEENNIKNNWDNNYTCYVLRYYLKEIGKDYKDEEVIKKFIDIINYLKKKYKNKYDVLYVKN